MTSLPMFTPFHIHSVSATDECSVVYHGSIEYRGATLKVWNSTHTISENTKIMAWGIEAELDLTGFLAIYDETFCVELQLDASLSQIIDGLNSLVPEAVQRFESIGLDIRSDIEAGRYSDEEIAEYEAIASMLLGEAPVSPTPVSGGQVSVSDIESACAQRLTIPAGQFTVEVERFSEFEPTIVILALDSTGWIVQTYHASTDDLEGAAKEVNRIVAFLSDMVDGSRSNDKRPARVIVPSIEAKRFEARHGMPTTVRGCEFYLLSQAANARRDGDYVQAREFVRLSREERLGGESPFPSSEADIASTADFLSNRSNRMAEVALKAVEAGNSVLAHTALASSLEDERLASDLTANRQLYVAQREARIEARLAVIERLEAMGEGNRLGATSAEQLGRWDAFLDREYGPSAQLKSALSFRKSSPTVHTRTLACFPHGKQYFSADLTALFHRE